MNKKIKIIKSRFVLGLLCMIANSLTIFNYKRTGCLYSRFTPKLCGEDALCYYYLYIGMFVLGLFLFLTSFKNKKDKFLVDKSKINKGDNMKKKLLIVVLFLVSLMNSSLVLSANEKQTLLASRTDNNDVVLAVYPYLGGQMQKDFYSKKFFKWTKYVPVGVLLQNYGTDRIWVYQNRIRIESSKKLYNVPITPYLECRSIGMVAGNGFFSDGQRLNSIMHDKLNASNATPIVTQSEFFYANWLEPNSAYYGLIYISERDNDNMPKALKSLKDANLIIPFLNVRTNAYYEARIPLYSTEELLTTAVTADNPNKYYFGDAAVRRLGGEAKQENLEKTLNISDNLLRCYAKGVAKGPVISEKWYGKSTALATFIFNEYGENISYLLAIPSEEKTINNVALLIADNMKKCNYQGMKERPKGDDVEGKPAFVMNVEIGDVVKRKDPQVLAGLDDKYVKFNQQVQNKIATSYFPSKKCNEKQLKPVIKVDFKGDGRVVELVRSSGSLVCDEGAKQTVEEVLNSMSLVDSQNAPFKELAVIDFDMISPLLVKKQKI